MATETSAQRRQRWQHIIEDWQASGKTQSAYCREHHLKPHQLSYWKRQLTDTAIPSALIPLEPLPQVNAGSPDILGLTLANGVRLDIPASQASNTVACDLLSAQADVMIRPAPDTPAYLYADPVDMRKSINGLAALVEQEMALSPFEAVLFVFCNRQRDKIKFLGGERSGFVLWYKRLEKHRFKWPADSQPATLDGALLNHCWMATTSSRRARIPHWTIVA